MGKVLTELFKCNEEHFSIQIIIEKYNYKINVLFYFFKYTYIYNVNYVDI